MGEIIPKEKDGAISAHKAMSYSFGLGGSIKTLPSDFIVEEVWENRVCRINYPFPNRILDQVMTRLQKRRSYLHFTLVKENWDTLGALNYIGRKIGASMKRFGISGMKDKRAITAQRVAIWHADARIVARLNLKQMFLKDFRYADDRITLGAAIGNQFTITIRDTPHDKEGIVNIVERFRDTVTSEGVPNYFGSQRFEGENAEVGGALKDGELRKATEIILEKVGRFLKDGNIGAIPNVFWYEKNMLRHLAGFPNDYAGALRRIPKKILRIYVHAYQSRLFNELLQQALTENTVPEEISIPGFEIPRMPELKTFQIERKSFLKARNFKVIEIKNNTVVLQFILDSGEYATTLLSCLIN